MSLLAIILSIVILGIVLYVINALIPMDGTVKKILNIVVIVVLVIWLLKVFGLWAYLGNVHI